MDGAVGVGGGALLRVRQSRALGAMHPTATKVK
jgi:hypothetical protein